MLLALPVVVTVLLVGQFPATEVKNPTAAEDAIIRQKLAELDQRIATLKSDKTDRAAIADVAVFAKAADWCLRHHEFFEPKYGEWTISALEAGLKRADALGAENANWFPKAGSTVLGYESRVDRSVQPYAVTLPNDYDPKSDKRWPLHVELHGRGANLNEVRFIHQHDSKPIKGEMSWIQLDVFGRTNNAYRWAGETDVFEAIADLKQRVLIDDLRVTLRGFSMGGAGVWHLGMHHPSLWSSIGAGAGFVDTVHHLKLTAPLSPLHQKLTKIYDAQEYALNAFDVPAIGYGGDQDPQLFAAKTMHEKAAQLGISIPLLIGPETGHKFHPDSLKEFVAFLLEKSDRGRPVFPQPSKLKFVTYTLKYNRCEWITIEEQDRPYERTTVEADVDADRQTVNIVTSNVGMLRVLRDVADTAVIDGERIQALRGAGDTTDPAVYFEKRPEGWGSLDLERSRKYAAKEFPRGDLRKRHDLQGPIDDAFMEPFVCVLPTGIPWSESLAKWSDWSFKRFAHEFDHRLRSRVRVVKDIEVTRDILLNNHMIVFGDPGSNSYLAKIVDDLPIKWMREGTIEVDGQSYSTAEQGVAMVYPNPLSPQKYLVLNSGHTFHEPQFVQSNANLYPRLGDFAVLRFTPKSEEGYEETVLRADVFDARWQFPVK